MLKTSDVATYLNVSQRTVHRLIKNNGLPSYWIGGQYRFVEHQLHRWLVRSEPRTSCNQLATSTDVPKVNFSGSESLDQTEDRYGDLLKPQTRKKHKSD